MNNCIRDNQIHDIQLYPEACQQDVELISKYTSSIELYSEAKLQEHHTRGTGSCKNARITYCNQARGQEVIIHDSLAPVTIARTI
jgi:hypothetical protein